MEARIESGSLQIKRGGDWKYQRCFRNFERPFCGQWCPAFKEYQNGDIEICTGQKHYIIGGDHA